MWPTRPSRETGSLNSRRLLALLAVPPAQGAGYALQWPPEKCAWVSLCIAAGAAVVATVVCVPLLKYRFRLFMEKL